MFICSWLPNNLKQSGYFALTSDINKAVSIRELPGCLYPIETLLDSFFFSFSINPAVPEILRWAHLGSITMPRSKSLKFLFFPILSLSLNFKLFFYHVYIPKSITVLSCDWLIIYLIYKTFNRYSKVASECKHWKLATLEIEEIFH